MQKPVNRSEKSLVDDGLKQLGQAHGRAFDTTIVHGEAINNPTAGEPFLGGTHPWGGIAGAEPGRRSMVTGAHQGGRASQSRFVAHPLNTPPLPRNAGQSGAASPGRS